MRVRRYYLNESGKNRATLNSIFPKNILLQGVNFLLLSNQHQPLGQSYSDHPLLFLNFMNNQIFVFP